MKNRISKKEKAAEEGGAKMKGGFFNTSGWEVQIIKVAECVKNNIRSVMDVQCGRSPTII